MGRAEIIAIVFGGVGIGDLVWIDAALLPEVVERGTPTEVVSAGLLSTAAAVPPTVSTTTTPTRKGAVAAAPALAAPPPPPPAVAPTLAPLEQVQVRFVRVGDATVDETFTGALESVAERLRAEENLRVVVVGHADERGSARVNMKLSKRRALAVERALVAKGADAARIDVRWFGERKPAVRGRTDAAWAANRRADVLWRRSE